MEKSLKFLGFLKVLAIFSLGFDLKILLLTATSATKENQKIRQYAIMCNNMRSNLVKQKDSII